MNSGLIILSIGLTALVGSLCTMLYSKVNGLISATNEQKKKSDQLEALLVKLVEFQSSTQNCINELGNEIQLREVYQSADDRHQIAIRDAKEGKSYRELVRLHGLSSDEAELIVALHGNDAVVARFEDSTA
ncbi:MAG: hypothetical protein AB8B84_11135 [Granulosicoccus sp.]